MKTKKPRKILSFFMAVLMIVSALPASALTANAWAPEASTTTEGWVDIPSSLTDEEAYSKLVELLTSENTAYIRLQRSINRDIKKDSIYSLYPGVGILGTKYLDLNGHKIDVNFDRHIDTDDDERVDKFQTDNTLTLFTVKEGATLTVCDSKGSGKIHYDGRLYTNASVASETSGKRVKPIRNLFIVEGTMILNDGELDGGRSKEVWLMDARDLEHTGGMRYDGYARQQMYSTGVTVKKTGTFIMNGGSVCGRGEYQAGISSSGKAVINAGRVIGNGGANALKYREENNIAVNGGYFEVRKIDKEYIGECRLSSHILKSQLYIKGEYGYLGLKNSMFEKIARLDMTVKEHSANIVPKSNKKEPSKFLELNTPSTNILRTVSTAPVYASIKRYTPFYEEDTSYGKLFESQEGTSGTGYTCYCIWAIYDSGGNRVSEEEIKIMDPVNEWKSSVNVRNFKAKNGGDLNLDYGKLYSLRCTTSEVWSTSQEYIIENYNEWKFRPDVLDLEGSRVKMTVKQEQQTSNNHAAFSVKGDPVINSSFSNLFENKKFIYGRYENGAKYTYTTKANSDPITYNFYDEGRQRIYCDYTFDLQGFNYTVSGEQDIFVFSRIRARLGEKGYFEFKDGDTIDCSENRGFTEAYLKPVDVAVIKTAGLTTDSLTWQYRDGSKWKNINTKAGTGIVNTDLSGVKIDTATGQLITYRSGTYRVTLYYNGVDCSTPVPFTINGKDYNDSGNHEVSLRTNVSRAEWNQEGKCIFTAKFNINEAAWDNSFNAYVVLMKDGVPDGYWKWADSVTEESRKRLGYGFTSSSNAIVFFDDTGKATFDLTSMFKGATDENFIPGRYDFYLKIPYKDGSQTKYAYSNRCSVTIEKRVTGADIIADGINVTKGGGTTTEDIPTYTMPGNTNIAELSAQPLMENATIPELKANWYIVSGEDIASVSSYGQLRAKKPGVVTVAMNVSGYEELNRVRVPANFTRYINIIIPIAGFKAGNVDLAAEVKNGTVYNDLKIPITHVRCYGGDWIENTENQYLTADCRYADGRTYSYNTASGYINMQDPVAYNDKVKVQFLIKPQEGYQFPLYVTYDGGSGYRESMANSSIIECNIPGNGTISPAAMLSGYEEFGKYADDTTGWTVSTPGLTYMLEQDCVKNPQSVYIDTVFINTVEPQEGDLRYAGEIPSGATGEKLAQNPDMMNVKTLTLSNIKTSKGENVITTKSKVSKITVKSGTGEAYKPVHYDDSSTWYENGESWYDVLNDRKSSNWYSKEQIESKVYESATYMHELDIYGDIGADGTEYFFAPDVKLIVNGRNVQLLNPTYNYNGTYSEENGNQYIGYDATHLSATYYVVTDTSPAYSYAQVVIPAPVSGAKPATEDDVSISGVKYTGSDALVSNHGIYASRLTWFIDTNTNGVPDEGEYGEGIFDTDGSFKGNTVYSAYVELKVREGKGRIDGNNFIMKIFGPPSPATIAKQKGSCIYEKTGRPMVTFDYNTEFVLPATTGTYAFPFKDVPNYETHHMTSSSYGYKDSTGNFVNEFVPGKKYTCAMTFVVDDEYRIKDDISFTIDGVKYTIGNGLTLDEQGPTRTYIVFNYSFIYPGGAGASVFGNIESFNSASDTVTVQLIEDGQTDPSYETTASGGTQNDNKFTAEYSFTNVASGSYTMRVIKKNHVTREYALTVGADSVEKNVKIHLLGDVDGDGNVSTIDWSLVRDHINETNTLTGYEFDCANVDKDEYITSIDCVRIQDHINESVPLW